MVRLVFRPYTQVRRSICTSESLRTSTRVSSGFILLRHSSPSFGSQRVCSCSLAEPGAGSARACTRSCLSFTFIVPAGFVNTQRLAHMLDSLVRVSRRVGKSVVEPQTEPRLARTSRELLRRPEASRTRAPHGASTTENKTTRLPDSGQRVVATNRRKMQPSPRGRPELRRLPERSFRLPLDGFTHCLTLSSKCFSAFPHGTCSLSDSCLYLALDGIYHPLWAAFPNNPTPLGPSLRLELGAAQALHPLRVQGSIGLHAKPGLERLSNATFPVLPKGRGFGYGLFPLHSPLLGESWLVSFPPLSDMLKFSGSSRLISGAS